jgi:hypothetical protein
MALLTPRDSYLQPTALHSIFSMAVCPLVSASALAQLRAAATSVVLLLVLRST